MGEVPPNQALDPRAGGIAAGGEEEYRLSRRVSAAAILLLSLGMW
jgi:hypothetical protein